VVVVVPGWWVRLLPRHPGHHSRNYQEKAGLPAVFVWPKTGWVRDRRSTLPSGKQHMLGHYGSIAFKLALGELVAIGAGRVFEHLCLLIQVPA
jgi:hypothetical protein